MNERQRRDFLDSSLPLKMNFSQWNLTQKVSNVSLDLFFHITKTVTVTTKEMVTKMLHYIFMY